MRHEYEIARMEFDRIALYDGPAAALSRRTRAAQVAIVRAHVRKFGSGHTHIQKLLEELGELDEVLAGEDAAVRHETGDVLAVMALIATRWRLDFATVLDDAHAARNSPTLFWETLLVAGGRIARVENKGGTREDMYQALRELALSLETFVAMPKVWDLGAILDETAGRLLERWDHFGIDRPVRPGT